ncbi:MAG: hypothetical protein U0R81_02205 [Mycobacterium sp.]
MRRSRTRAAAISWVIAGGMLCGGFTALSAPLATADTGGQSNDSGSSVPATGSTRSRDAGQPSRHPDRSRESNSAPDALGGTAGRASARGASDGPDQAAELDLPPWLELLYPWPFPWPPCTVADHCVGLPAPADGSVQSAPPPQAPAGDYDGVRGMPPLSPAFPGHPTQPGDPGVVDADGGAVISVGSNPSPLHLPPLVGGPTAFGGAAVEAPVRGPAGASASSTGTGPRDIARSGEGSGRERLPGAAGSGTSEVPASFRVGYPQYLREAKVGEVAVFALPGVLGILALTALGGVVGYRQAKAGRVVRAAGTARFLR